MDALAPDDEEGRGLLRKASGKCKQLLIRGCPNGETHIEKSMYPACGKWTQGTETSKYLKENKSNEILLVAASERGRAQTRLGLGLWTSMWGFKL